jgi:hypothetical protein
VLQPLSGVHIAQKTVKHSPQQKLLDALMGILSGCKALYEIDVGVRPDLPLKEPSAGIVWPTNPPSRGPSTPSLKRTWPSCARL